MTLLLIITNLYGKLFKNIQKFPEIGIIRLKNQNNWGKKFDELALLEKLMK